MPREADFSSIWWREGFPGVVEGAPWHRCVETGEYGFVLDTEKISIPHLGPAGDSLFSRPGAELELRISANGKTYSCRGAGKWSRFTGPRLIESGRFLQRADVTDLVFSSQAGEKLNVEARFETIAWPDRLGMILSARPGLEPFVSGEESFGRVKGGFGLNGENYFQVSSKEFGDSPAFTLAFWVFVPGDFRAGKNSPWLVCKNAHEQADGNFGITLDQNAVPRARLNIGGGKENAVAVTADRKSGLKLDEWNFLAITYDSAVLRLFVNGRFALEEEVRKARVPKPGNLTIGDRGDGLGDGAFRFRGVVDEVRWYEHAVSRHGLRRLWSGPEAVPDHLQGAAKWTFSESGKTSLHRLGESWSDAKMELVLAQGEDKLRSGWSAGEGEMWDRSDWAETGISFHPARMGSFGSPHSIEVEATDGGTGESCGVQYEPLRGWHRINLDGIDPIAPEGQENPTNDAMERIRIRLDNPSSGEKVARLLFEKSRRGIQQKIGTPITGVSAILRDARGNPTGIPVQLSKNWHVHSEGGVYSGQWFHGISQVRLPAGTGLDLELCLVYGHWGGVAAASHSQLSLIGWGSNQRWDQAAIGSWGESICFEPEQVQANCTITDVRPVMVTSMGEGKKWGWTNNHGGGDFFRLFDRSGKRIPHSGMRANYHRQGPCLTEVSYPGQIHGTGIEHRSTVSLSRRDDMTIGTYRIRMDVARPVEFSRFVIFQIGADTYSSSGEKEMAVGDVDGLIREWKTEWGGNVYRTEPVSIEGEMPWASLHATAGGNGHEKKGGAWGNRGVVIREWSARLGGREVRPCFAERGLDLRGGRKSSTLDLVPPADITKLEKGDFVEATIEHIIVPAALEDYYGPNEELRGALRENANTWEMIFQQARGDQRKVRMETGTLHRSHPDIRISAEDGAAVFTVSDGLGYVPVTVSGLRSHDEGKLFVSGKLLDQSVHGKDFWQTDFDPARKTWSRTYNVLLRDGTETEFRFSTE